MTDSLDAIRRDHTADPATADDRHPDGHCHQDSTAWPCDTAIVLAALDAALARERRLREHVPAVGGWCDSGIYLECECGWTSEPPYRGVALTWEQHLDVALAETPEAGS